MILPIFEWIKKYIDFKTTKIFAMKTSHTGVELIKKHEAFMSKPYLDPVGIPTIGYGATYYPNGNKVTMSDNPITKAQAEEMLKEMLIPYEVAVKKVSLTLNQNQFDALVSFSYNVGTGALSKSTLAKKVKANPNDLSIAYEFARWNKAGGKILRGLVRRRKEEADLYFTEI